MPRKVWTEEEKEILKTYTADRSIQDLLPRWNWDQIKVKAYKLGYTDPKNTARISSEINTGHSYSKRLTYDDNIFKKLNPVNAYWAGFIAADGCLSYNRGRPMLGFSLKESDTVAVKAFADHVQYSGNLYLGRKQMDSGIKYTARLMLYGCDGIFNDLQEIYNITPKKSLTLQPPNITDPELIKAFIVGYIDGDGCISFNRELVSINILGTLDLLLWIKNWFDSNVVGRNDQTILKVHNYYSYSIAGKRARAIKDTLSTYTGFRLMRKWERFNI